MPSTSRSSHARPSTAPPYYLGRPAHLWMTSPGARRARAATRQTAECTSRDSESG